MKVNPMKRMSWIVLLIILSLLAGCNQSAGGFGGPTPTLAPASVSVTHAPDARAAMTAYLDAWGRADYAGMYAMTSTATQTAITQEDFIKRYDEAMVAMGLKELQYEILSTLTNPSTAEASIKVTYKTYIVGDLLRDMLAHFVLESGQWKLQWEEALVFPELRGGNKLAMNVDIPARGDIYDRSGRAIASQADAVAVWIDVGLTTEDNYGTILFEASKLTGVPLANVEAMAANAQPGWHVPVGEALAETVNSRWSYYSNLSGLHLDFYNSRYYVDGGIAPHAVGYQLFITREQLDEYRRRGYSGAEKIGASGVERWAEDYLAGKRGGRLYVIAPDGSVVTTLAAADKGPAASVYLTLDSNFQREVQKAISGFRAAAVVIERDTGRVLAIASSPTFDPNFFEPQNTNSADGIANLYNDARNPLVNRATQGEYPLGSVFKVITYAAALESGTYTPETTYDCQYEFTELNDRKRYDWTWDHCQEEALTEEGCTTQPSGLLTLSEGLMRSCNPYFWHIGKDLYEQGRVTAVADLSRAFGLGSLTGIEMEENPGNITNPSHVTVAVNEAIGQDPVLVTPLQVATFMAAIGNGGTLYRPSIIQEIKTVDGQTLLVFKPEARGTLPIKPENLKSLQDAMVSVIKNPRGTANFRLRGLPTGVLAAGKTGTAESGLDGYPHAWFAGYTFNENPDLPDIAIAVIVENIGEGSEYAAPMFKRIIEIYLTGKPQSLYWWESSIGVTRTATPEGGEPANP